MVGEESEASLDWSVKPSFFVIVAVIYKVDEQGGYGEGLQESEQLWRLRRIPEAEEFKANLSYIVRLSKQKNKRNRMERL